MIKKHDLALLEYDNSQEAIINPNHENHKLKLPKVAVFAFLGDKIYEYAKKHRLKVLGKYLTISKIYPVFLQKNGENEICICEAPVGAAVATSFMDWLIAYGVKKIIATGSCGVLVDIPENVFLVPTRAIRDEGTSFHYLPASRYIDLESFIKSEIEKTFSQLDIEYIECTTWTTDAFFRETKEKVKLRIEEGCSCVDMECSALAACAKFRSVEFGQFFFTADSLAKLDSYDIRNFGEKSLSPALKIAINIAINL